MLRKMQLNIIVLIFAANVNLGRIIYYHFPTTKTIGMRLRKQTPVLPYDELHTACNVVNVKRKVTGLILLI